MELTLYATLITTYRIEITEANLADFLGTYDFQPLFHFLNARNIEIYHYPQLKKYHFTGLYCDAICEQIGHFIEHEILS
jgi:hypothetical protein